MLFAFWIFAGFAFALGAVIGSFLNVVIVRLPRGESIVAPSSHCRECGTSLPWYHNIPIVSWIWLGGECHSCGTGISVRYPLVEGAMALMTAALWWKVARQFFELAPAPEQLPLAAITLPFGLYTAFLGLLVAIAAVDFDHYVVPHTLTLPGIVLGLAHPWLIDWLVRPGALHGFWPPVTWRESALGAAAGAVCVALLYFGYLAARGMEGLGGGDLTLMALVGAWLGWPALPFVFFAASVQGLFAALVARLADTGWLNPPDQIYGDRSDDSDRDPEADEPSTGKLAVPFGPFIALAAVEHFFLGPHLPAVLSSSYLYEMWVL